MFVFKNDIFKEMKKLFGNIFLKFGIFLVMVFKIYFLILGIMFFF